MSNPLSTATCYPWGGGLVKERPVSVLGLTLKHLTSRGWKAWFSGDAPDQHPKEQLNIEAHVRLAECESWMNGTHSKEEITPPLLRPRRYISPHTLFCATPSDNELSVYCNRALMHISIDLESFMPTCLMKCLTFTASVVKFALLEQMKTYFSIRFGRNLTMTSINWLLKGEGFLQIFLFLSDSSLLNIFQSCSSLSASIKQRRPNKK